MPHAAVLVSSRSIVGSASALTRKISPCPTAHQRIARRRIGGIAHAGEHDEIGFRRQGARRRCRIDRRRGKDDVIIGLRQGFEREIEIVGRIDRATARR